MLIGRSKYFDDSSPRRARCKLAICLISNFLYSIMIAIVSSRLSFASIGQGGYEAFLAEKYRMLRPSVSEYVRSESANFIIERGRELKYSIRYRLLKDIGGSASFNVDFENPAGGDPLSVRNEILPGQTELEIISPTLSGIGNGKIYAIKLSLYTNKKLVSTHEDHVRFLSGSDIGMIADIHFYNEPNSNEIGKLASRFISKFNERDYFEAANMLHYPQAYTAKELDLEKDSIRSMLQFLHDDYGMIKQLKPAENQEGYKNIAGIQAADERYWNIYRYAPRLYYEVEFESGEKGLLGILFCDIDGLWEIRGLSYFLDPANSNLSDHMLNFKRKLNELMKIQN